MSYYRQGLPANLFFAESERRTHSQEYLYVLFFFSAIRTIFYIHSFTHSTYSANSKKGPLLLIIIIIILRPIATRGAGPSVTSPYYGSLPSLLQMRRRLFEPQLLLIIVSVLSTITAHMTPFKNPKAWR